MWPNQRAAGEGRWWKRRHIGSDGDQCRQERESRSAVSPSLLKISPAQLSTGMNAVVRSEMRWTVYVKIMQQIPAPSKCRNTSSALCLRPWSCRRLHAWKSPVNAGLFMHAQTLTGLGFYCASPAIYWMVQTSAWTVACIFSGIVRKLSKTHNKPEAHFTSESLKVCTVNTCIQNWTSLFSTRQAGFVIFFNL